MSTIAIVHAGLRVPSSTKLLADGFAEALQGHDVQIVALRDYAHAIVDAMLTGLVAPELEAAMTTVTSADALVAVTPTFSASYSGLFKSFFDIVEPGALHGKPVLLAATGGTARHSLVIDYGLRPLLSYLGMETLRTGVFAATEDFGGPGAAALQARISKATQQLHSCLSGQPEPKSTVDEFDDVTPFEQLLGRAGAQQRPRLDSNQRHPL